MDADSFNKGLDAAIDAVQCLRDNVLCSTEFATDAPAGTINERMTCSLAIEAISALRLAGEDQS